MILLRDKANVEACYPFRGRINEVPNGEVRVIQMKDVSPEIGVDWSSLISTELEGRGTPKWLKNGSIIFMSRGSRNFAIFLEQVPEMTVCSPLFFHIHTKTDDILPSFLAWQLNQRAAQDYFKRERMGTHQLSIRRKTLEEMSITVPPMETQKKIMELDRVMREEQRLYKQLAINSAHMMQALTQDLLTGKVKLD